MQRSKPLFFVLSGMIALAVVGIPAIGQPDVIVGDLSDTQSYGSSGGIAAFAIGTTSCNIGTLPLTWLANTPLHPVIGQNIHRLRNGRFEQVGMSWLKHGFTALAQSLCATCQNPGTGTLLGVNCSDPYVSQLNGNQTMLGPRSEVNASTGSFPYPFTGPAYSGVLARRLQVAHADLDPALNPGAIYFAEAQYIHAEDANAGNDNNNASYRRAFIAPNLNSYSLSLGATTVRTSPAIQAWKDTDPSVNLVNVDVPGDGRIIVAYKASDLGGGLYHHEFAVENLNSHRSVGGFTVPLPAGATVQNVGFHDVPYHSNEPFPGATGSYNGNDWPGVILSNGVNWQTETFAVNQQANAIRWGTLYNFRFDSNQQPGNPIIDLWRPGTPSTVVAPVMPGFSLAVVGGVPTTMPVGQSLNVDIQATNLLGQPDPASGVLNYSVNGGAIATAALTFLGSNAFRAVLPAGVCFDTVDWWVSVAPLGGGNLVRLPVDAPATTYRTESLTAIVATVFRDQMDGTTANGWTIQNGPGYSDGAWDATPVVPGNFGIADPPATPLGGGRCWVTKNVSGADVDGGETRLISPVFNLLGYTDARVTAWLWFDNDNAGANTQDTLQVQVSSNGGTNWITMASLNASTPGWVERQYRIGQFLTPTATMRLRFVATDPTPTAIVEAGVDDVRVVVCPNPPFLGPAGAGSVGATAGGPYDVVQINGSAGGYERRVTTFLNQAIILDVLQPPTAATPAGFTLYAMIGVPTLGDAYPLPFGLGTFAFAPCPVDPLNPAKFVITDNLGIGFCAALAPSFPAPWTAVINAGFPVPFDLTIQGLIADPSAPFGASTTNGIILRNQ